MLRVPRLRSRPVVEVVEVLVGAGANESRNLGGKNSGGVV